MIFIETKIFLNIDTGSDNVNVQTPRAEPIIIPANIFSLSLSF
jgi:hypothetical protein